MLDSGMYFSRFAGPDHLEEMKPPVHAGQGGGTQSSPPRLATCFCSPFFTLSQVHLWAESSNTKNSSMFTTSWGGGSPPASSSSRASHRFPSDTTSANGNGSICCCCSHAKSEVHHGPLGGNFFRSVARGIITNYAASSMLPRSSG